MCRCWLLVTSLFGSVADITELVITTCWFICELDVHNTLTKSAPWHSTRGSWLHKTAQNVTQIFKFLNIGTIFGFSMRSSFRFVQTGLVLVWANHEIGVCNTSQLGLILKPQDETLTHFSMHTPHPMYLHSTTSSQAWPSSPCCRS